MEHDTGVDGLKTISKLEYTIDEKSANPNDNMFKVHNPRIFYVNISTFMTMLSFENDNFYSYDLREPKRKIIDPRWLNETKVRVATTDNWSKIPYFPTDKERRADLAANLMKNGKNVPGDLVKQIDEDKRNDIETDSYNNFQQQQQQQQQQRQHFGRALPPPPPPIPPPPASRGPPRGPPQAPPRAPPRNVNVFSQEYTRMVNQKNNKPQAQASARVRLGGAF